MLHLMKQTVAGATIFAKVLRGVVERLLHLVKQLVAGTKVFTEVP